MEGNSTALFTPQQRKRAMGLLFTVLLLVMMGFSILFPVMPYYVEEFGGDAFIMGWISAVYSIMQFIFAPIWGRMSDRVGRRPLLMLGLLGYVVSQTLFGLATELWMLFGARALAGMLSAATMPTAMAYIADITPPEERAKGMGLIGAAFGLGVIIGPGVGGVLGRYSLSLPFFVSAGVAAVALLGVINLLPESLPKEKRTSSSEKQVSRWAAFTWDMAALHGVTLALSLGMTGMEITFGFFAKDRLGLESDGVAVIFVVMGFVAALVQGFLVGKLQKLMGESRLTMFGLAVGIAGMLVVAFGTTVPVVTLGISLIAAGVGFGRPANSALISQRAKTGQGMATGLMSSFDSLGRIIGPVVGGWLYRQGMTLPYFSGAGLFAVAGILATVWAISAGMLTRPPLVQGQEQSD